jgi:iron complex transport system ATP-binding protein
MSISLSFQNVQVAYPTGAWTLDVPACTFGAEALVCVVGPNGSGKSTLLRCAAGLLAPRRGEVTVDETPIASIPRAALARRVGFLPQEVIPMYRLRVEEVAALGRFAHQRGWGCVSPVDRAAVDAALTAVGMTELRERPFDQLSGGERRRALLAPVLAQQPELMLLDEPTTALDPHHAGEIMRILRTGPRVVMATHDLNLASLFADRVVLMRAGRIVADGAPSDVLTAERLHDLYGRDVLVHPHPENGLPMVLPRRCPT